MNKNYLLIFILMLSLANQANAGLKLDALSMLERAPLDFAGDMGEAAGVVTDGAATIKEVEQTGQRAKTLYEKGKMLKESVAETLDSTVPGYGDEEEEKSYEDEYAQAEEQLDSLPSSLNVKQQEAEYKMENRRGALYQEAAGKKQAAEGNIENLEQLYEQAQDSQTKATIASKISEYENEIEEFDSQMTDLESDNSQILQADESYQEASKEKQEASENLKNVFDTAQSKFGDLNVGDIESLKSMSAEDKSTEYNKVIKDNFLLAGEAENAQTTARVKKKRTQDLIKAMVKAFVTGAKFKNAYVQKQDKSDQIETNVVGADQQLSSIGMTIEQTVQEIRLLQDYNKLMLADIRLKTAQDMMMQDYRLKNYDKNPASLNLDNYVFTEDDIKTDEGRTSFLSKVRAK